jgi:hypothetical protein
MSGQASAAGSLSSVASLVSPPESFAGVVDPPQHREHGKMTQDQPTMGWHQRRGDCGGMGEAYQFTALLASSPHDASRRANAAADDGGGANMATPS